MGITGVAVPGVGITGVGVPGVGITGVGVPGVGMFGFHHSRISFRVEKACYHILLGCAFSQGVCCIIMKTQPSFLILIPRKLGKPENLYLKKFLPEYGSEIIISAS